jgi:hypothetical protein
MGSRRHPTPETRIKRMKYIRPIESHAPWKILYATSGWIYLENMLTNIHKTIAYETLYKRWKHIPENKVAKLLIENLISEGEQNERKRTSAYR